jgi:hypothetical protein
MADSDETNALLREMRDVLVAQHEKYKEYLNESKRQADDTRRSYEEQFANSNRAYKEQVAQYQHSAWARLIAWMVWATVMISIFSYWGRQ